MKKNTWGLINKKSPKLNKKTRKKTDYCLLYNIVL